MRLLAIFLFATLCFHAYADDAESPKVSTEPAAAPAQPSENEVTRPEHSLSGDYRQIPFSVKLGAANYSYEEMGIMHIDGHLFTLGGEYRRSFGHLKFPMYFDVNLNILYGTDEYSGSISHPDGTDTPANTGSRDQIYNLEGHYGFSFFDNGVQMMDLYAGLGVWYLENKINGTGSYTRDITYIYAPIGIRYSVRGGSAFKFTMGLQYQHLLLGIVKSQFSDINPNADDGYNTQTDGSGFTLNAIGEFTLADHATLFVEAYYKYWEIQTSDSWTGDGGIWVEPHNKTKISGLSIGTRF